MSKTTVKKAEKSVSEEILDIAVKSLDDGKAEDIVVMDLQGKTSIAESEGEEKADWVLIDAFDVIIHIFKPEVREFYNLEKMWSAIAEIRKIAD